MSKNKNIVVVGGGHKAEMVEDDLNERSEFKVIRENLLSSRFYEKPKSDKLIRSLVRHDPEKLAKIITSL